MKSITHVLLLAGACLLVSSCIKNELPHRKLCQVTYLENSNQGGVRPYTYTYNSKRQLASIILPFVTFSFEYNQFDQPVTMTHDHGGIYKLIYKQGRLSEVYEGTIGSDDFHLYRTYVYDNRNRIIECKTPSATWRWEYIGNSRNFRRKIGLADVLNTGQLKPQVVYEYQYDNKIHPWATWINMPVNPFYQDLYEGIAQLFEPIPENNWTYQEVFGYPDGIKTLGQRFYYTYQYDGDYPVSQQFRHLGYQAGPDNPVEDLGSSRYTYDCKDNSNGHLQ